MTNLEIGLTVITAVQMVSMYWLTKYNRDLNLDIKKLTDNLNYLQIFSESIQKKLFETEKKFKFSNDALEVLSDLKNGGALLHVERVDRNDVFFHQGGQYR